MKRWSTVQDFIANGKLPPNETVAAFEGFASKGDGGASLWLVTGATGTPSQSPIQRGDNLLTDTTGAVFKPQLGSVFYFDGTNQWFPLPFGDQGEGLYQFNGTGWNYYEQAGGAVSISTTTVLITNSFNYDVGTALTFSGYSTPGDGGGAQWVKTALLDTPSQTPAVRGDGTLTDALGYVWKLSDNDEVTPESVGAKGDGVTDDLASILSALESARGNNSIIKPGVSGAVYKTSDVIDFPNGRYNVDLTGSTILVDSGVTVGVRVGSEGPNPYRGEIKGLRVEKSTYEGGDTGISLINVVEANISNPQVLNFSKSFGAEPSDSGRVAYNHIENPLGQNHEYGFYLKPSGTGYVNENTVVSGRLSSFVAGRLKDQFYLDNIGNSGVGHNRFIGVSAEGYSGGGSTGDSCARVINNANDNVFLYCRGEKYGDGWSEATYVFGTGTARNKVEDSRIDTTVVDPDESNDFVLPNLGIKYSDVTGGAAHPAFKYTRNVVNNDDDKKYAVDVEDTATSSSSKVGAFRYVSPRSESRAGTLVDIQTGYGQVFKMDDAGTILPRDNFADLGSETNRYRKVETLAVNFSTKTAASAENLSLFVDVADGKLKFKDGAGVVTSLT